jgi:hypothetical protein
MPLSGWWEKGKGIYASSSPVKSCVDVYEGPSGEPTVQYSLLSFSLTIYSCKIRPYRIFIA